MDVLSMMASLQPLASLGQRGSTLMITSSTTLWEKVKTGNTVNGFSNVDMFCNHSIHVFGRYQNLGQQYHIEEEPGDDDTVAWIISGQRGGF